MSNNAAPPIRGPQLDDSNAGGVKDSVNLFRGDVNLNQSLLQLPGRKEGQGLDVDISLLYQSNVFPNSQVWNRDSPTGTLGLGWSQQLDAITLDQSNGASPCTRTYSLNGTQLIREPTTPFLFTLDGVTANVGDGPVATSLVTAFAQRGLAMSASATMSASSARWIIDDDDNQRQFILIATNNGLWDVHDGGESYQLKNYQFLKIIYYPSWERWAITDENGLVSSYGGSNSTRSGSRSSTGNSIEWGVGWTSSSGNILWSGPSSTVQGQQQYARAWHIASASDIWGDAVTYTYETVEQAVGSGGLTYTKAIYNASITDVFGRQVLFSYGDKLWSDEDEAPREYVDPHRAVPSNDPNAFQDCYETRFLASLAVIDADGAPLGSIEFEYAPQGGVNGVANVTSFSGRLKGDTYKRFLTGITYRNAEGQAQPSFVIDYYLDATDTQGSPGAIKSLTSPEGGVRGWRYQKQELGICERSVSVTPPASFSDGAKPRVWFGSDYGIALWYDSVQTQLSLEVKAWYGRWISWLPSDGAVIYDGDVDLATLEVIAATGYFAISFVSNNVRKVFLYTRDTARAGQWYQSTVEAPDGSSIEQPLSYDTSSASVALEPGNNFIIVSQQDAIAAKFVYDRLTWRWTTRTWTLESALPTLNGDYNFIVASNEYCFLLTPDGSAQVNYLDASLTWKEGGTSSIPGFSAGSSYEDVQITAGSSMVAICHLEQRTSTQQRYTLFPAWWDSAYQLTTCNEGFAYNDQITSNPTSWTPTVVNNTLIAIAGHLLRFDGCAWQRNDNLAIPMPASGSMQRYAYGPDVAVQVYVDVNNNASASVLCFDANTDNASWSDVMPSRPSQDLTRPSSHAALANWPSAGANDYLIIGQYLYFRGDDANWGAVVETTQPENLLSTIQDGLIEAGFSDASNYIIDSSSVLDQAPQFLSYNTYDGSSTNSDLSAVPVLQNGQVLASVTLLNDEVLITRSESDYGQPGVNASGPNTFVTYPQNTGHSFDDSTSYTLHRFAGDSVDGNIVHYAVVGCSISDGFGKTNETTIFADPSQATCNSNGQVVKYYQSTVTPSDGYGHVTTTYQNGLTMTEGDYFGVLDGQIESVKTYDADGNLVSQIAYKYQAYTERSLDPSSASAGTAPTFGAFAYQTIATGTVDDVTSSNVSAYIPRGFDAPWSSQAITTQKIGVGMAGSEEAVGSITTYLCQLGLSDTLGDAVRALHMLSLQAQSTQTWADSNTTIPTSATAGPMKMWPSALGDGVQVPGPGTTFAWEGAGDPTFPFASYQTGAAFSGWRSLGETTTLTLHGLTLETQSLSTPTQSKILSVDGSMVVAQASNASIAQNQWAYLGFEDYESNAGWTFEGDTSTTSGDGYLGVSALNLSPGASLSTTITPATGDAQDLIMSRDGSVRYVLGFALKTPADFDDTTGAWTLTCSGDGAQTSTRQVVFENTGGRWRWVTCGVIVAGTSNCSITISAQAGTQAVLLDDVFIAPLVGDLLMTAYNSSRQIATAYMNRRGSVMRTLRNRSSSPVGFVGADNTLFQFSQHFLSRAGNEASTFAPESPNASLTFHFADEGILDTFCSGDEWTSRWQPGDATAWSTEDGVLVCSSSASDTSLSWRGWEGSTPPTAALLADISPLAEPASLQVNFGAGNQVAWTTGTGWSCTLDGDGITALAAPTTLATQWILLFGEDVLLFFGNGQLLFSHAWSGGVPDTLTLDVGSTGGTVRNLGLVGRPRLQVTYSDASGAIRQSQTLDGSDSLIIDTIVDAMGNPLATTKPIPNSFDNDGSRALLAYDPGVVDEDAFLAATANTWLMTGRVADYYQGQDEGHGVTRSNDQGYPYIGKRFFAAPKTRLIESGLPGLPYAIHDVEQPPNTRSTTTFGYGCNNEEQGDAPPGSYYRQQITGPLGLGTTQYQTYQRQTIGNTTHNASETPTGKVQNRAMYKRVGEADGLEHTVGMAAIAYPNHYEQSPPSGYTQECEVNALGQPTTLENASSFGAYQIMYNQMGRVRFILHTTTGTTSYWKYDGMGRCLEQGTLGETYTAQDLAPHVDDRFWPESSPHSATRADYFDGDGDDAAMLGMNIMVATTTHPPDGSEAVFVTTTEAYEHDARGRIVSVEQHFSLETLPSAQLKYTYNNTDQIVRIDYPEDTPLTSVYYGWDDCGRSTSIGTTEGGTDIASYRYTPSGEPYLEKLGNGLDVTRETTSPGWLGSISVKSDNATTPFWSIAYTYNPDSTIATQTVIAPDLGTTTTSYTYDDRGQLATATASGGNPGTDTVDRVDGNGNILAASCDGEQATFTLTEATNQLQDYSINEAPAVAPVYDHNGFITQNGDLGISYDPALLRPSNVDIAGEVPSQAMFAYGSSSNRTLKQLSGNREYLRTYYGGASTSPMAIWQDGRWMSLVYGPFGLVAYSNGNLCYPIKDALQSVRAVTASNGEPIALLDYSAFGQLRGATGEDVNDVLFRYMGQEWDEDLGVYNFKARLYDPQLRRFLAPDSAHQYPSPYVFVGNQPISNTDPTGDSAQPSLTVVAGLAIAVGVGAAGLALSLASGGVSDELAMDIDATLFAEMAGKTEAKRTAYRTFQAAKVARQTDKAITRSERWEAFELEMEAETSIETADISNPATDIAIEEQRSPGKNVVSKSLQHTAFSTLSQIGTSASYRGTMYSLKASFKNDFSWSGFWQAMAQGAFYGAIGGALGSLVNMQVSRRGLEHIRWSRIEESYFGKLEENFVDNRVKFAIIGGRAITTMIAGDITQAVVDIRDPNQSPKPGKFLWNSVSSLGSGAAFTAFTEFVVTPVISPIMSSAWDDMKNGRVSEAHANAMRYHRTWR